MQKFTRSLTREIDFSGERVAVTMDAAGLTVRPVGARRPPHVASWATIICAATSGWTPTADKLAEAVQALKKGGEKAAAPAEEASASASAEATPPAEPAPAAAHASA
jgi:hypothetical protein